MQALEREYAACGIHFNALKQHHRRVAHVINLGVPESLTALAVRPENEEDEESVDLDDIDIMTEPVPDTNIVARSVHKVSSDVNWDTCGKITVDCRFSCPPLYG